ncbi:MAG: hypothetical protein IAF38_09435 [Bacteroidia bacterium]|nr:hypothetical protein [Bacteroidia bacterium]
MKFISSPLKIIVIALLLISCSGQFKKVDEKKFEGVWELKGRDMFEGIEIKIAKEKDKWVGRVTKINSNKFIKLFSDSNDVWVSEIKRTSDFEFKLTEKKIAKELFALYGQSTSQEFKVQFIDDNTIGLTTESSDPTKSTTIYKRKK